MQKSLIVRDDETELNELLRDGWKVVNTCPMPSSCAKSAGGYTTVASSSHTVPTCLVIVEKF